MEVRWAILMQIICASGSIERKIVEDACQNNAVNFWNVCKHLSKTASSKQHVGNKTPAEHRYSFRLLSWLF